MFPRWEGRGEEGVRSPAGGGRAEEMEPQGAGRRRQGAECVYVYIDCGHLWVNLLSQLEVDTLIRLLILLTLQYTRASHGKQFIEQKETVRF